MTRTRLFFEKPPDGVERQRLLLLTHHFPPSEAVGALRWHRFVNLFAARGWSFDVVTAAPSLETQTAMPTDLPPGTRVWGVDVPDSIVVHVEKGLIRVYCWFKRMAGGLSFRREGAATGRAVVRAEGIHRSEMGWRLGSPRGWVRLWFTFRDAAAGAAGARCVASAASAIADPASHRAIITSGPPHYWHEGGRRAAVAAGIPLVLDLRDPWSITDLVHEYFATPAWLEIARRQERRAVEDAALVVTNTGTLRDAMASHYVAAADRFIAVMNGYDEGPVPAEPAKPGAPFTIGYAGSIYFGRDPRPLFAGVARVIQELELEPGELQIRFIGDVEQYGGVPTMTLAREAGLAGYVEVGGRLSREEAYRFMAGCQVLVSLPWEDKLTIPAKLFEYMCFSAWLLVFAQPESAIEQVLRAHEADVVDNDDVDGVAAALRTRFLQHRRGDRPAPFSVDRSLSRQAQADLLLDALEPLRRRSRQGGGLAPREVASRR
jgi:hypothetical protein